MKTPKTRYSTTRSVALILILLFVILSTTASMCAVDGVTTNDGRSCYSEYSGCGVPTPYPTKDDPPGESDDWVPPEWKD